MGKYVTKESLDYFLGKLKDLIESKIGDANKFVDPSTIYTKTEIDEMLTSAMHYKGTVDTVDDLPAKKLLGGPKNGDVYNVVADGSNYAFDGNSWDKLSENVDLSGYYDKTSVNSLLTGKQDNLLPTQLNAVNSGITSTKVSAYEAYSTNKQDTLTTVQLEAVDSGITATKVKTYDGYSITKQDKLSDAQIASVNSGITADKVTAYDAYATSKQSTLSTAQLNACNSGITADKVSTYDGYAAKINSKKRAWVSGKVLYIAT